MKIKYNVGDQFLLKLDDKEKQLDTFPLLKLKLRVGLDRSIGKVFMIEFIPSGKESFTINASNIDKGSLTEFYNILDDKINFLVRNPELRV